MIVEDKQGSYLEYIYNENPSAAIMPVAVTHAPISFSDFIDNYHSMKDLETHIQLRKDLIKHQWEVRGQQEEEE